MLRYYALLLMLARRAEAEPGGGGSSAEATGGSRAPSPGPGGGGGVGGGGAALGLPELATWLRDECCRVLGIVTTGSDEDGGGGGEARRASGSEAEGALEGLSAAMRLLPVGVGRELRVAAASSPGLGRAAEQSRGSLLRAAAPWQRCADADP
jgi:hypothetical protein